MPAGVLTLGNFTPMVEPDPLVLLVSIGLLLLQVTIFVLQATLLGLGWRGFRRYHRLVWWTAGVLLLFLVPNVVVSVVAFDPGSLGVDTDDQAQMAGMVVGMVVGAVVSAAVVIGMSAASVPPAIAWWASVGVGGWPRWGLRRKRWGVWLGFWTGVVAGVVSLAGLMVLGVKEGEDVRALQAMLPGLDAVPLWVLLPVSMAAVSVFAITEEITYRGLLLPAAWRCFGSGPVAFWVSAVLTSAVWSVMHFGNTDSPLIKLGQIFVLGLWFSWLARRYGLPAAIAGHLGLNLTAAAFGLALYEMGWA
ncbi:MAG: CPBP family intramembrane glutamic endopeptidase [Planctomycetota bacterium]